MTSFGICVQFNNPSVKQTCIQESSSRNYVLDDHPFFDNLLDLAQNFPGLFVDSWEESDINFIRKRYPKIQKLIKEFTQKCNQLYPDIPLYKISRHVIRKLTPELAHIMGSFIIDYTWEIFYSYNYMKSLGIKFPGMNVSKVYYF